MRAVLQRVTTASVSVDGAVVGRIGPGLMVLVCAMRGDDDAAAARAAAKVAALRIFSDDSGRMNLSLGQTGGAALVVSQFTLGADTSRGNRPGFSAAAPPEDGRQLYDVFCDALADKGIPVETGHFGASMQIELCNDGPVTISIDV
ncbi:MAG: D-aminoacyl-tRNA deacylase [Roseovarius sp.]|nr:D-aminoacyl-tRNA deacylase [Roseovarius sp.]